MGCNVVYKEDVNERIRNAIRKIDFATIHNLLLSTKFINLDPTLIHDAIKSSHIDIVTVFLENSIHNFDFNINEKDKYNRAPIEYALEYGFFN